MRRAVRAVIFALSFAAGALAHTGQARAENSGEPSAAIAPRAKKEAPAKLSRAPGQSAGGWTATGGALAIVLALILAAAKLLRPRALAAQGTLPTDVVRVLGRKLVDYRHTLYLVRCGSRLVLVGASQNGLATLAEISDPVEVERLAGLCLESDRPDGGTSFEGLWQRLRRGPEVGSRIEPVVDDPAVVRLKARMTPVRSADDVRLDDGTFREAVA